MSNFPVKSNVLSKTRLVPTEFGDGGNCSGYGSGSVWGSFICMDWSPIRGSLRCPRMVACFLSKYFSTRSDDYAPGLSGTPS